MSTPVETAAPAEPAADAEAPSRVEARLAALQASPIFFALPEAGLRRLAHLAREVALEPGESLVVRGEIGDSLYAVMAGDLCFDSPVREGYPTWWLRPGDLVGMEAVALGRPHAASVVAHSPASVVAIDLATLAAAIPLEAPGAIARLEEAAAQLATQLEARRPVVGTEAETGEVVCVASAKGGSGKTLVAVNLAGLLAGGHPGEVLLLDLALPYNEAAFLAGVVPLRALSQLSNEEPARFEEDLVTSCVSHPGGFAVLTAVVDAESSELVTAEVVARALGLMRRYYRTIVVDTPTNLSEVMVAALERAAHVVVLVTPEVGGVKDAANLLTVLREILRLPEGSVHVVLNHPLPRAVLRRDEVERVLRRPVDVELGHGGDQPEKAALRRQLLVAARPRGSITRSLRRVAALVEPGARPAAG